eukprot:TRINITY_DN10569_c1_g1_i1.p1 TRINITY_DN10569_c1_g1~~TRINITY_DN10569_c1_g1_i1.p1  ORF type:complete len:685 (-),score=110.48 TRINITY_DN10569_c1_g1_i1:338-2335(-)
MVTTLWLLPVVFPALARLSQVVAFEEGLWSQDDTCAANISCDLSLRQLRSERLGLVVEDVKGLAPEMDAKTTQGIPPPKMPFEYNGIEWPKMTIKGTKAMHVFAIGDWGGLAGKMTDDHMIIQYAGGDSPGPHTMARYRIEEQTRKGICLSGEMINCFGSKGSKCHDPFDKIGYSLQAPETCCQTACGYDPEVDVHAQNLVAAQMKERAKISEPDYILNVGDNFYWGGISGKCGDTPMSVVSTVTATQFKWIFEDIYTGEGLDGKPWLSVLGNHDWGGRTFNAAWDQQIAYTWVSDRWIMPAAYWKQHVEYPDLSFSVDIFLTDSNIIDAHADPDVDAASNLCSGQFNSPGSSCASVGGVPDRNRCHSWFQKLWDDGAEWVTGQVDKSLADWQILVTHFPCGHKKDFYKKLHVRHGLDLLVTGHTHKQQMWDSSNLGGLTCFITGGGGGIVAESPPSMTNHDTAYGFYDLIISKSSIDIESISWDGTTIGKWLVKPLSGSHSAKGALEPDACQTALPGSKCHKIVSWAMESGIHQHPEWFPGLNATSSFEDFQHKYYDEKEQGCERPCKAGVTSTPVRNPAAANGTMRAFGDLVNKSDEDSETQGAGQAGDSNTSIGSCETYRCGPYATGQSCQCNSKCVKYGNCCMDYVERCLEPRLERMIQNA